MTAKTAVLIAKRLSCDKIDRVLPDVFTIYVFYDSFVRSVDAWVGLAGNLCDLTKYCLTHGYDVEVGPSDDSQHITQWRFKKHGN